MNYYNSRDIKLALRILEECGSSKTQAFIKDYRDKVIKVQRVSMNWLWAPKRKDGTIGAMAKKNMEEAMDIKDSYIKSKN